MATEDIGNVQQTEEAAKKSRLYFDFPNNSFGKPRTNAETGEEFCDVYLPKGFEIKGTDIDGNDLTGRDLGSERYYLSQTISKNVDGRDMQFVYKSKFFEGGRRFSHNPEYPVRLRQRVQDPVTEEWSDGPEIKVDAEVFEGALKDWQYAKDENNHNVNVETLQVPKDMVTRRENKDGDVWYSVKCPDTTIDRKNVSGLEFTFGQARDLPWDDTLCGFNAFMGENIPARDPSNRDAPAVWVNASHANMAYKNDRIRVQGAAAKAADAPQHAAPTQAQERIQAQQQMQAMGADKPLPPTVR